MSLKDQVYPPDIAAKISADFPHESQATLLGLLDEYKGPEKARVIRCIVHLAEGSADKLIEYIGNARTDYRDVIYWAEYGAGDRKVRDLNQPFSATPAGSGEDPLSFIGGQPFLPQSVDIPACTHCGARMCFLFQIALPADHRWRDTIVSLFQCISCCSDDTLIPEMLSAPLHGAEIPPGFLTRFQTNFRLVVSNAAAAQRRTDYDPLVVQSPVDPASWCIGAEPQWLGEDETPGSYESVRDPAFLFQVPYGMTFPMQPSAPSQKTLDLAGNVVDEERPCYELFLGNAVYFFGFGEPSAERIYVVTQAD